MENTSNYINKSVDLVRLAAHEILDYAVYMKFKALGLHRFNLNTYALLSLINGAGQADSKFLGLKMGEHATFIKQCTTMLESKNLVERGDPTYIGTRKYMTYKLTGLGKDLVKDQSGQTREILSHDFFMKLKSTNFDSLRLNYLAAISVIVELGHASSIEIAERNNEINKTMRGMLKILIDQGIVIRNQTTVYAGRNREAFEISGQFNELLFGTLEDREKERIRNRASTQIRFQETNIKQIQTKKEYTPFVGI